MHGESNGNGFITVGEFQRTMNLLEEIRTDIKGDVSDLSKQLMATENKITKRQDEANGKLGSHDTSIKALDISILDVRATVGDIMRDGCAQKADHVRVIDALAQAGVVPDTGEILHDGRRYDDGWRHHAKKGAWVGAGAGFAVLVPHLLNGLHWLIEHFGPRVTP